MESCLDLVKPCRQGTAVASTREQSPGQTTQSVDWYVWFSYPYWTSLNFLRISVSGPTYLNNKPLVSRKKIFSIFWQKKKSKDKDDYNDIKDNPDAKPKSNETRESVNWDFNLNRYPDLTREIWFKITNNLEVITHRTQMYEGWLALGWGEGVLTDWDSTCSKPGN